MRCSAPSRRPRLPAYALTLSLLALALLMVSAPSSALAEEPRQDRTALSITHPTAPLREPIVLHFRKTIALSSVPSHYLVHVSADRRFVFYVNGQRMGTGPAASDLPHWRYETFDLAPALHPGDNLLSATVWNFGIYSALAHVSDRTAFLVQGNTQQESAADTNATWWVTIEPGVTPIPRANNGRLDYLAASPGEALDAAKYGWDWQSPGSTEQ